MSHKDLRFEVKQEAIDQLTAYAQHEGNELCGVLTGSQIGENCFRISKVSPPCVARNSHCGCERDAKAANAFIAQDFEQSGHTRIYIGEWHTHPETHPAPSGTDRKSIIKTFSTSDIGVPFLIMAIVGTCSIYFSVYNGKEFKVITPIVL